MSDLSVFYGPNAGYVLELYERYQRDPESVPPATRTLFERWKPSLEEGPTGNGGGPAPSGAVAAPLRRSAAEPGEARPGGLAQAIEQGVRGAAGLAQGIREYGHQAARIDP